MTVQLDQTSVRIDEDFGEIVITIFMQGQSELNVSVQVDTRVDTASGKNTIRLPSISQPGPVACTLAIVSEDTCCTSCIPSDFMHVIVNSSFRENFN